jgi:hypothetical protein
LKCPFIDSSTILKCMFTPALSYCNCFRATEESADSRSYTYTLFCECKKEIEIRPDDVKGTKRNNLITKYTTKILHYCPFKIDISFSSTNVKKDDKS